MCGKKTITKKKKKTQNKTEKSKKNKKQKKITADIRCHKEFCTWGAGEG